MAWAAGLVARVQLDFVAGDERRNLVELIVFTGVRVPLAHLVCGLPPLARLDLWDQLSRDALHFDAKMPLVSGRHAATRFDGTEGHDEISRLLRDHPALLLGVRQNRGMQLLVVASNHPHLPLIELGVPEWSAGGEYNDDEQQKPRLHGDWFGSSAAFFRPLGSALGQSGFDDRAKLCGVIFAADVTDIALAIDHDIEREGGQADVAAPKSRVAVVGRSPDGECDARLLLELGQDGIALSAK